MIRLVFGRLGLRSRARRRRLRRARRPEARRGARRRRLPVQGRGRPVAGVPGRPHVDRRRARHPVRGLGPDLREDVREPPVLRGQADLDGRARSRSATRTGRSSSARAGCAAQRLSSPDIRAGMAMLIAALCAEGDERDPQRARRSTAATSGSTSACAALGARIERRSLASAAMIHPIPSGTRDVLPGRDARAARDHRGDPRRVRRARLRRGRHAGARVRGRC